MQTWYCRFQFDSRFKSECAKCKYRSAEKEDGEILANNYGALVSSSEDNDRSVLPSFYFVEANAYACNAPSAECCSLAQEIRKDDSFEQAMIKQFGSLQAYKDFLRTNELHRETQRKKAVIQRTITLTLGNKTYVLDEEMLKMYRDAAVGNIAESEFHKALQERSPI